MTIKLNLNNERSNKLLISKLPSRGEVSSKYSTPEAQPFIRFGRNRIFTSSLETSTFN